MVIAALKLTDKKVAEGKVDESQAKKSTD